MKLLGKANLFIRTVTKDGKKYNFPELSVSSKDIDGNFKSTKLSCRFKKDVSIDDLSDDKCYCIDIKDSILNVKYDDFKKTNVFELFILDFEFEKEVDFKKSTPKKDEKKNPFKK